MPLSLPLAPLLLLAVQAPASSTGAKPAAPRPEAPPIAVPGPVAQSPNEIVSAAPAGDWVAIAPADLLVMDLAPDAKGGARRVVMQLMPPPFSRGWVDNVRKLAAAHWWDGLAVVRVQDNYVAQWGDPDGEDKAKARALPTGLSATDEAEYTVAAQRALPRQPLHPRARSATVGHVLSDPRERGRATRISAGLVAASERDPYAALTGINSGWPVSIDAGRVAPVHCYGMVGVARNLSPDAGTGAELYAVIGHAPRHLDRNIALVARVIEGIEHLSSLPRGHGALGFYDAAQGDTRVPILSIRLGTEAKDLPTYQYLSTESASFARYADARANRRDPFFIVPAGGADICNVPVPVRRAKG